MSPHLINVRTLYIKIVYKIRYMLHIHTLKLCTKLDTCYIKLCNESDTQNETKSKAIHSIDVVNYECFVVKLLRISLWLLSIIDYPLVCF